MQKHIRLQLRENEKSIAATSNLLNTSNLVSLHYVAKKSTMKNTCNNINNPQAIHIPRQIHSEKPKEW